MADNVSALPRAAQQKLESLRSLETPPGPPANNDPPTPPTPPTPPAQTPTENNDGERVTLSRQELNDLRAEAGRAQTAENRAENLRLLLEDLQARLTELEGRGKSGSSDTPPAPPAAPSAPSIDTSSISFTSEEEDKFGESRSYIERIVDLRVASHLNKYLPEIYSKVEDASKAATGASTAVATTAQHNFQRDVAKQVPNLREIINHRNWQAFLDEVEPHSGHTFSSLIAYHVNNLNLDPLVNIYKAFEKKYIEPAASDAGFAGAGGGDATGVTPPTPVKEEKLKFSDRRKASEDYRMKRNGMTYEKLQEIQKKFDEADKKGLVDYSA